MKLKETPTNGRKEQTKKLINQIENVVVSTIITCNEHNKIYDSYSLQWKQIIAIKIVLFTVLNVDL